MKSDPATQISATAANSSPAAGVRVQILDFSGFEQLIARHRGRVVIVDCWSTSCPPCMQEFPHLVAMHRRYGAERLACISLSFDYEGLGTPEKVVPRVERFLKEQQATFDNVVCRDDADTLYARLELAAIPAVFVYDRAGKLRRRFDNSASDKPPFTYADVEPLVRELFDEPGPAAVP